MVERKVTKQLSYKDVEKAGQEGNALFYKWLEEQTAIKDKYPCDCHKNYGKDCLFPEKHREEGCN